MERIRNRQEFWTDIRQRLQDVINSLLLKSLILAVSTNISLGQWRKVDTFNIKKELTIVN